MNENISCTDNIIHLGNIKCVEIKLTLHYIKCLLTSVYLPILVEILNYLFIYNFNNYLDNCDKTVDLHFFICDINTDIILQNSNCDAVCYLNVFSGADTTHL